MRDAFASEIAALIDRSSDGARNPGARDDLLERLLTWQSSKIAPYGRLLRRRPPGAPLPGLPTDVFRYVRVAAHAPEDDVRVFLTSGTTSGARGQHAFLDLSLYDRAARAAAAYALFPDVARMRMVMLAAHPDEAPGSSLSYMLGRFESWFGGDVRWVFSSDRLDLTALREALSDAVALSEPVALLGTSFAFVHAEEGLSDERFALPAGSRVMQTGGFKGRSREVDKDTLLSALSTRYGVPPSWIVAEYGMTELSSQMYETTLRAAALGRPDVARRLWVPGWVRARVLDPETLEPRPEGTPGVLAIDDAANLDSVAAIVTSDLAIQHGEEIELLGRAPGATPRGCSLAIEEALDGA